MKEVFISTALEDLNGVFVESTTQTDDGYIIIKGYAWVAGEVIPQEFMIVDNELHIRTV